MINNSSRTALLVRRFQKVAWLTVGAVLFLILVGGLVRMTGSGMGCPDWPQCFGQWVPPTDISQLPLDYKTRFAVAGKEIADFDAVKTWIEYLNRLIGVLIGGFALLTTVLAFPLRGTHKSVWRWSLAGLILVILQGFLGAYVVRTDLKVGIITLHMFMALLVLAVFLTAAVLSYPKRWQRVASALPSLNSTQIGIASFALVMVLLQILLGTQVREGVDEIAKAFGEAERANWLSQLGISYTYHKYFYYAVIGALGLAAWQLKPVWTKSSLLRNLGLIAVALVGTEILLGLGMHHFAIPKILQPLHLLFASMLFADLAGMLMVLVLAKQKQNRAISAGAEMVLEQ